MRALLVLATLAVLVSAAPLGAAAPSAGAPEDLPSCDDTPFAAKCEALREDVRDLLTCTCPPW